MIDKLYHDSSLVRFYDLENSCGDDLAFCAKLAEKAESVLDLGCGTGRFLSALSGKRRAGVDPAPAMLTLARAKEGGAEIDWVEADARHVRLGETFDLVVMTGHAFQCFLSDADQLAVFQTIAAHLAPGGRFVFDSRQPSCAEWEEWTPSASRRWLADPELGEVEAFNDYHFEKATGIVTYGTYYRTRGGKHYDSQSQIRFTPQAEIAERLADAGLAVEHWLGNWQGGPLGPDQQEIIAIGRRA